MACLLLTISLAPLALSAAPAMAQDEESYSDPSLDRMQERWALDDQYRGSNHYCGSDCAKQDRIKEDEPSSPYELENSFNNGRQGKSVSGIITNMLEPSGGR